MPTSVMEQSRRLSDAVQQLLAEVDRLRASNHALKKQLQRQTLDMEQQLAEARKDAADARRELEQRKIAATLRGSNSDNGFTAADAKKAISQLVREIDKCLELVKK